MRIEFAESDNGLSVDEKTNKVTEHIKRRTGHNTSRPVKAFAVFVNSAEFSGPPGQHVTHFTGFVQTKLTTAHPLKKWMGDECIWTPVPGGLYGNTEFNAHMANPAPWKLLPIISG